MKRQYSSGFLFFFLFILVIFQTYALSFVGQTFENFTANTSVSNTSVNITGLSVYADRMEVASTFISFENATYTNGGTFTLPLVNLTGQNALTYSASFPNVSASTSNTITVQNGLSQNVSGATINFTTSTIPSSPRQLYPNGTYQTLTYTYAGGVFSAQGVEIPPGVSTIELDTAGPSIVIAGPGNTSSDLDGTLNFTFTPTDDNLLSCSLYIENQLWTTANSTNGTLSNITVTMVANSPGGAPLSWFISCVDTAGNTANSSTYLLTTIQTGITAPAAGPVGGGGGGATTTPAAVPIDTTPLAVEPEQATTLNSFFKSDMAKFVLLALFIVGMIWVFGGFKR